MKESALFVSAVTVDSRELIILICHEGGYLNEDTQLEALTPTMSHDIYVCFLRK